MTKVNIVKAIVKLYFLGALTGSFIHLVAAAHKGGLTYEAYAVPFMVDGIAIIGMVMRGEEFSKRTRKIGFRTQLVAGMLSLAGNMYAAHNIAGMAFGAGIVILYIAAEKLSDVIESAEVDVIAEAERIAREAEEAHQAKKQAAIDKARKTRAANKAKNARDAKALERLVNGK